MKNKFIRANETSIKQYSKPGKETSQNTQEILQKSHNLQNCNFLNRQETLKKNYDDEKCRLKFQAQPVPSSTYHPKIISGNMSQKKPIQFEEFHLYSIKRAEKRAEFNKKLKEKQEILNERKKQQEAERLLLEKLEMLKLRRQTIFRAKPIRK